MQLEFISNTGCYLEHNGAVLGMDLWLTQGAFEGSWFHFPPLRPTKFGIADCDYIYISHIHPDHCDFKALVGARRDATFIVPNYMGRLLERKLRAFGFDNVVSLAPDQQTTLSCGATITLFGQFVNNLYAKADFGNMIDSAIMIEWDGHTILNCNDNYLDEPSAKSIAARYPKIDLALMPHSASGPYPASFLNLSTEEKVGEAKRLQRQYVDHFVRITEIVKPRLVAPTAAEYAVVGRMYQKNPYIGLAAASDAVTAVNAAMKNGGGATRPVQLDCGTLLDVDSGNISGLPVRHLLPADLMEFAATLKDVPYPYDWEASCTDVAEIDALMEKARQNVWRVQSRLDWKRDYNLYLSIDEKLGYAFNFATEGYTKLVGFARQKTEPFLECFLSRQLLHSILTRKSHWNNAEGGLHIDFNRRPNEYVPEVFVLLSFLHVPVQA
ncbi:MAG: MBL fold metallo-hydrolase [Gammaproteobacteria bacterium]|nr:MBL fold metallo-hydrolase [Gammaproteobacteria bacterium]